MNACISESTLVHDPSSITPETLPEDIRRILSEVTRYLNLEKLLPCYKYTVGRAGVAEKGSEVGGYHIQDLLLLSRWLEFSLLHLN